MMTLFHCKTILAACGWRAYKRFMWEMLFEKVSVQYHNMCYCSLLGAGSPPPKVLGFSDKGWCEWPSVTVCSPICSAVSLDPERCLWLGAALPLRLTELLNWVRNEDLSAHLRGAPSPQCIWTSHSYNNWRADTHLKLLFKLISIKICFLSVRILYSFAV